MSAVAAEAMAAWGGAALPPRLVVDRENAVYDVQLRDGRRAALRLHRAGYRSPAAIAAELAWMRRLVEAGFPCPAPLPAQDGALLVAAPDGRPASLVSWIEAVPLAELPPEPERFRRLGGVIAQLHELTDDLAPERTPFPAWSAEALVGDAPVWGRYWENPALTADEVRLLHIVRTEARSLLEAECARDTGLIHADLLAENVLEAGARLWLIDFDDSGVGPRGYDLGTALIGYAERPDYPELAAALVAGYASRRGSAADLTRALPLFLALRAMASCGWVLSRTGPGDPRRRAYADRAVRLAERWLARQGAGA